MINELDACLNYAYCGRCGKSATLSPDGKCNCLKGLVRNLPDLSIVSKQMNDPSLKDFEFATWKHISTDAPEDKKEMNIVNINGTIYRKVEPCETMMINGQVYIKIGM